ncbi:MAG: protein translocase subunit SecD [Clostridia bacterium]|nr:protein translocase subunit SecD [Clostridia bacterium]
MRLKSAIILLLVIAITVALGFGAFNGYSYWTSKTGKDGSWVEHQIMKGASSIKKGLDVAGGVRIIYTIEENDISSEDVDKTEKILRNRLDAKGLTEATITKDEVNKDNPMLIVEIPGFNDPEEAISFLGQTAKLQFVDFDGNVVLEGDDIVGATRAYERTGSLNGYQYIVQLELSPEAVTKFADATDAASKRTDGGNVIGIYLDNTLLSYPSVNERIETSNPIITGSFTAEESKNLADLISSGALPLTLLVESQEYVGPTIGQKAFDVTLNAGVIAFILIILFLIIMYRIPGLVSSIALTLYTIVFILICENGGVIITLPGIAGIILSIAMAVDASIISYERLREELKLGKTLKTSIDLAFEKAFSTVRDSSVTTFISAIVLYILGTGSIKGFAISLMIGLVLSFLMAIFVLKFLLRNVTNVITTKNPWFYGVNHKIEK